MKFTPLQISILLPLTLHSTTARTRATTRYREGLGHAATPATFADHPKLPQQASGSGSLRTPTSDNAQAASLRLLQPVTDPKCKQEGGACEAAPAA
ncbi:hypothetical protein PI124_g11212 [Phytophthora idaei]|nr:hypothetical protein PI125_g17472 [Phytophthora idaei]KAG3156297.1 hypothetical protein PI126_g8821 [Phytophthora idaei]KAG3243981.1 hypothetical protein PI124_g11212 [Phytophthora idaei]